MIETHVNIADFQSQADLPSEQLPVRAVGPTDRSATNGANDRYN
ncbi:MAG: hypothetical protein JWR34_5145 [Mycobacterium sp.]|nr:hypothetical protein [Mycobacterium sp.]